MAAVRVLCVDDERQVLEGLALQLRRGYRVHGALSGAEGLAVLEKEGPFAVVLSDMRMPGMDGAAFLAKVREAAPDTTRMLLTGHADVQSAIDAVNHGGVFRFLTKPCSPEDLRAALAAAAEQYRLVTAERELLEETLLGTIKTLAEILSITNPQAFGRANRLRQLVLDIAEKLGYADGWALEAAAMMLDLGVVALPDEVVRRLHSGQPLTAEEKSMARRVPVISETLLSNIPRLDEVREILSLVAQHPNGGGRLVRPENPTVVGAAILKVATDFDQLESRGLPSKTALEMLQRRVGDHNSRILKALVAVKADSGPQQEIRAVTAAMVEEGMVFLEDVRTATGMLVVARGLQATAGLVERMHNYASGYLQEPVRVLIPASAAEA